MSLSFDHWSVAAAKETGKSHRESGMPCQDAFVWWLPRPDTLIAAIADGAGSKPHSEIGSKIVTEEAVVYLSEAIEADNNINLHQTTSMIRRAFSYALFCLNEHANQHSMEIEELATTLAVVVARPNWIAAGTLGDGAIVIKTIENEIATLLAPMQGEFANETFFLTSQQHVDLVELAHRNGSFQNFAMLTDGLKKLAFSKRRPFKPFIDPLFSFHVDSENGCIASNRLSEFLRSPAISDRTQDDVTLLLAHCNNGGGDT